MLGSSAWLLQALLLRLFASSREESFHLLPGVEVGGLEQGGILVAGGLKTEQLGGGALLS